ncbi:MAG: recombination protein RecR [Gammaproteobacteria bacterium]|nr:MAG: recombination protein RecR [Gammaproteobacteria bacterium]
MFSPLIDELIRALRCLPGVGPKSAQRMALHLLERDREGAARLSLALQNAVEQVGHCQQCRTFCESEQCGICRDASRNHRLLCVVETPADLLAIEQASMYRGVYFVLMGHLSPIDGIGPDDIGLDLLGERLKNGGIEEVILATGTTVEGEATAHYIFDLAKACDVTASRIAHGVPLGGELEYVDANTISLAFSGRKSL